MQIGDAEGMPGNNPSVQNGYGIQFWALYFEKDVEKMQKTSEKMWPKRKKLWSCDPLLQRRKGKGMI